MTIEVDDDFKKFLETCSIVELGIVLGEAELSGNEAVQQAVIAEFKVRDPSLTFPAEGETNE